jgi:class 3 adenylate cyclase
MTSSVNEKLLDERLARLEQARAWSPRVISKLESHVRSADEDALFRINPFGFAAEKNVSENEAVDLFLHAAAVGLFSMDWHLLCSACSCVVESFRSLKGVHNQFHCNVCTMDYEASLDDLISVTFTINPQIRDIALLHPERLSAWDYFFKFGGTTDGRLPDGTPFVNIQQSFTKAVTYLPPGETTRIEIETNEGTIVGGSMEGKAAFLYHVDSESPPVAQVFRVVFGATTAVTHEIKTISPGRIAFEIENTTSERGTFLLALLPKEIEYGHVPITFAPFLSGKRLLTSQTFRELFRSEVIQASEGIGVREITLLFTDLKGSTALYDRIGDLNAFALVQQHFERLQDVTVRHDGTIIKTIGDAVMAAFLTPRDAVRAAIAMRREIAEFNRDKPDRELILKIGLHAGAAIAVTLNDRLDYFGQTVNIAARVQSLADSDEIYLSDDVFRAEGVQNLLSDLPVSKQLATLKGIREDFSVYCLKPESKSAIAGAM